MPNVSVHCLWIVVSLSFVVAVSSVELLLKGKERSRVRRMRGTSRRKEEKRKIRKEEKKKKRIMQSYDKKELRKRITDS